MTIKELYEWAVAYSKEDYPLAQKESHSEGFAGFKTDYFIIQDVSAVLVDAHLHGNPIKCILLSKDLPEVHKPVYKRRGY